ncbi:MAG: LptF/LptG family permease [Phycisphaerales bacterium]|nr:MAG: LptF/LptG family permease [Phycisphaerales bacterium]
MNLLDRYIARQFLLNIVILAVILFSFVITIDAAINMNRFARLADQMGSVINEAGETVQPGGLRRTLMVVLLIADLWWPRLFQLSGFLLGMLLVAGMGFTCAQMVHKRELVAVLASGQSLHRVWRPFLIVAVGLSVLQVLNQELVLPRIAPLLTRDHGQAGQRALGETRVPLLADSLGRRFYAETFDADAGTIEGLIVYEFDASGVAERRISARRAAWRDGAWACEPQAVSVSLKDRRAPAVLLDRIETDLDPTTIRARRFAGYAQNLSFAEVSQLIRLSRRLDGSTAEADANIARLERIRWGRFAVLASNVLALIICLPFFIMRVPGNMAIQGLRVAPVAGVALMGGVLGSAAAVPGLPPVLGVFVPVMILVPVAIATASSVKT